jgi:RNA polymerase sigma-70 factor (ECF subfamily)
LLATDMELVRKARRGDASAFHLIVDRYAPRLFGLAYSMLGDATDAEDAVQETLAGAYRGLAGFEARSSLWTWLARILVRQASRQRRIRRGGGAISIETAGTDGGQGDAVSRMPSASLGVDVRIDLAAALETLSDDHRQVIVLRELEQMSYEEIAEVLDVPRGTVESRLHRARAELKKKLSAYIE